MFFFSLILTVASPSHAGEGLLRLLTPAAMIAPRTCDDLAGPGAASDRSAACEREICESQTRPLPADAELLAQIRATPDPRDAATKRSSEQALDRAFSAAHRLRKLAAERPPAQLVRETLKQGPRALDRFLRALSQTTYCTFPLLRNTGGVGNVFPPELRADASAIAAAQSLARVLNPQLSQDFIGRMASPGFGPFEALALMRTYYATVASTATDSEEVRQAQGLLKELNGPYNDSPFLYDKMMTEIQKTTLGLPKVVLKCPSCEADLEALVAYQLRQVEKNYPAKQLPQKRAENLARLEQSCRLASWGLTHMAPTPSEIANFEADFVRVKGEYQRRVFTRFSTETQQHLWALPMRLDSTLRQADKILPDLRRAGPFSACGEADRRRAGAHDPRPGTEELRRSRDVRRGLRHADGSLQWRVRNA